VEGVRPAVADDLPRLRDLAAGVIGELAGQKGGIVWQRHAARREPLEDGLRDDLDDTDTQVLVGTIDGAVVGYSVTTIERLSDEGILAVIRDLFVEPEARGVGVGAALMEAVLSWAGEHHCIGVDALALPGGRATKNFFESFGLVARAIVVHRDLRTGDEP
jgi:GNAT superfamily N-acetyltransferase